VRVTKGRALGGSIPPLTPPKAFGETNVSNKSFSIVQMPKMLD